MTRANRGIRGLLGRFTVVAMLAGCGAEPPAEDTEIPYGVGGKADSTCPADAPLCWHTDDIEVMKAIMREQDRVLSGRDVRGSLREMVDLAAFLEHKLDADVAGRVPALMADIDALPEEYEVLCWDMQPGDAIVFGAEVVHGARQNRDSALRRAALSIRYVGDDATWDPRDGTDPIVTAERVGVEPGQPPRNEEWFPTVWTA